MAHFAKIENNLVTEVIVVNNDILLNEDGFESEEKGIAFCKSLFGLDTDWVQTSYSGSFRNKFAGLNDIYVSEKDVFVTSLSELNPKTEESNVIS